MQTDKKQEKISEIFESFKNADHKAQVILLEEIKGTLMQI